MNPRQLDTAGSPRLAHVTAARAPAVGDGVEDFSAFRAVESLLAAPEPREDLVALDAALTKLAETDKQAAELVQLRYFAGLPLREIAEILGIAPRTADRLWAYAKAWLHQEIESG